MEGPAIPRVRDGKGEPIGAENEHQGRGDAGRSGRPVRAHRGPLLALRAPRPAAAGPADRGPRRWDGPARPGGPARCRLPEGRGARPGRAVLRPLPAVARATLVAAVAAALAVR